MQGLLIVDSAGTREEVGPRRENAFARKTLPKLCSKIGCAAASDGFAESPRYPRIKLVDHEIRPAR